MILADEPMSSLDPALAHTVMELLRGINQEDGITVIASLHVLELAQAYGRRVIGLHGGRVVHDGPPESLDAAATERIFGRAAVSGRRRWLGLGGHPGGFIWSAVATEVSAGRMVEGLPFMWDFLRRMVPPDSRCWATRSAGRIETIQIALVGTGVAALLALPLGFAAARNAAPPWLFYCARSPLNVFRAVDTLVYALFFVAAVGLGPFPGVLAVIVYTADRAGQALLGGDRGHRAGAGGGGAGDGRRTLQVLRWGVLPQLVPQFLSFTLYRFETNIRAAAVLGFVGAGGIGFYIQTYLRLLNYPAAHRAARADRPGDVVDFASSRLRARLV